MGRNRVREGRKEEERKIGRLTVRKKEGGRNEGRKRKSGRKELVRRCTDSWLNDLMAGASQTEISGVVNHAQMISNSSVQFLICLRVMWKSADD